MRITKTLVLYVSLLIIILTAGGCAKAIAVNEVSLDIKIGQMIMVGFRGLEAAEDSAIISDITNRHIGGVILFDYDVPDKSPVRNIASANQLKKLTAQLQSASTETLLIAIDQEGGKVARLKEKNGFPPTVSAEYLGSLGDLELTYDHASRIAKTLADMGINLNLAPVVDLNINPDNPVIGRLGRSFSAEPEIVTSHAREFIKAHNDSNVLCAVKHFPGHGSSLQDSHLGLVDVTATWSEDELSPYKTIINAQMADVIMTAHIFNSKLDREFPATLSKSTLIGLLRKKLGYDGVIISDDMQMGAIADNYGFERAIKNAINASVDIILIANNSVYDENIAGNTITIIKKLLQNSKIEQSSIDESYRRITKLKSKITKTR